MRSTTAKNTNGDGCAIGNPGECVEQINRAYAPEALREMAEAGKLVAAREARALVYLIAACTAGVVMLHALLQRRRFRGVRVRTRRAA